MQDFLNDLDCQDIVSFNLQLAIQNCIDIAAHIVSEEGIGVPASLSEIFHLLEENDYLSDELTEKMVRAVGFRNLLVHEYGRIDLKQVYRIAREHIEDLNKYLLAILTKLGISE